MSGFAHLTGQPDGPPTLPPFMLADGVAAQAATWAVMMALYHRDVHGGDGQLIDINLIEPLARLMETATLAYDQLGKIPGRVGNRLDASAPRNAYRTADDKWLAISSASPNIAMRVYRAIGRPELAEDPDYVDPVRRQEHGVEVDELVAEWVAERTLDEAMEVFEAAEVAAAPVYDAQQLLADEHLQARGFFVEVDDPDFGAVTVQAPVARMSETPGRDRPPRSRPRGRQRGGVRRAARGRCRTRWSSCRRRGSSEMASRPPRARRSELATPASSERMCEKAPALRAPISCSSISRTRAPRRRRSRPGRSRSTRSHEQDWGRTVRAVRINGARHGVVPRRHHRDRHRRGRGARRPDRPQGPHGAGRVVGRRAAHATRDQARPREAHRPRGADRGRRRAGERGRDRAGERPPRGGHLRRRRPVGVAARAGRRQLRSDQRVSGRLLALTPECRSSPRPASPASTPSTRPYPAYQDPEGYRRSAVHGSLLGFDGKWAIHPSQIPIANEVFSPTPEEVEAAAPLDRGVPRRRGAAASAPSAATDGWSTPPTCVSPPTSSTKPPSPTATPPPPDRTSPDRTFPKSHSDGYRSVSA